MQSIKIIYIGLFAFLVTDNDPTGNILESFRIHAQEAYKHELELHPLEGKWYYNDTQFTGYALSYHANGTLAEQIAFKNGKKHGVFRKWYPSGQLRTEGQYVQNRLNKELKSWWSNGNLSTTSFYVMGERHGKQCKWYPNGQLARLIHLNFGKEDGLQQAWLQSGKLYANYEAKNGRFFGLKRSNLCYELKDEVVQQ